MSKATQERIGRLYKEGKWRQDDKQAKIWAEELDQPKAVNPSSSKKSKK